MTDLALLWRSGATSADLELVGADLATDEGLRTAIIISLFTDAPARPDDPLPAESRGGWWGDAVPPVAGDRLGSRLWLFRRAKRVASIIVPFREAVLEALAWLIDDGIARRIDALVEPRGDVLAFEVIVYRADGTEERHGFTWEGTDNGL